MGRKQDSQGRTALVVTHAPFIDPIWQGSLSQAESCIACDGGSVAYRHARLKSAGVLGAFLIWMLTIAVRWNARCGLDTGYNRLRSARLRIEDICIKVVR